MESYNYLTKEDILSLHYEIIEEIGGTHGVREEEGLDKIVDFIHNDFYYPELEDKLTYLVFSLCTGHYFSDGNKRISIVAAAHFLIRNHKHWAGAKFYEYFHAYAWHIAAGNINKDLFLRIIHCYLNYKELDEDLKIEILHAMQKNDLYDEEHEQTTNSIS